MPFLVFFCVLFVTLCPVYLTVDVLAFFSPLPLVPLSVLSLVWCSSVFIMSDPTSLTKPFNDYSFDLITNDKVESSKNELSLVGKIVFDKKHKFKVVKSILKSAWTTKQLVHFSSVEQNMIQCSFANHEDLENILETSPWNARCDHIVLIKCPAGSSIDALDFTTMEFWLKVHNLPQIE